MTVTANGASNSPLTIPVSLTVTAAPNLTLTPSSLNFAYQVGGATPAAQSVAVASSGAALSYAVTSSATWLAATPASGSTPGSLSVSMNPSGLKNYASQCDAPRLSFTLSSSFAGSADVKRGSESRLRRSVGRRRVRPPDFSRKVVPSLTTM